MVFKGVVFGALETLFWYSLRIKLGTVNASILTPSACTIYLGVTYEAGGAFGNVVLDDTGCATEVVTRGGSDIVIY